MKNYEGFRPLPGFCVSQFHADECGDWLDEFPSPSGVLCFSIPFRSGKPESGKSFRPLPGFCVSQCRRTLTIEHGTKFPSPSGVLCFSIQ